MSLQVEASFSSRLEHPVTPRSCTALVWGSMARLVLNITLLNLKTSTLLPRRSSSS